MDSDPKAIVASGFDAIADRYAGWTAGSEQRRYWIARLCERLPAEARILDLGCGNGMVAKDLISRGYAVMGLEISARQIDLAREHAPAAQFFVADMANCPCAPISFDAAIALYSIAHVPRSEHASLLRSVADCLRPGGWFLASMGAEETEGWVGPWLGTTMHFSHFGAKANETLVRDAGFKIVRAETIEQIEDAQTVHFLWLLAERM